MAHRTLASVGTAASCIDAVTWSSGWRRAEWSRRNTPRPRKHDRPGWQAEAVKSHYRAPGAVKGWDEMSITWHVDEIEAGRREMPGPGAASVAPRGDGCGVAVLVGHPARPAAPDTTARAAREAWTHATRYPTGHRRRQEFAAAAREIERLAARDTAAARRRTLLEAARG